MERLVYYGGLLQAFCLIGGVLPTIGSAQGTYEGMVGGCAIVGYKIYEVSEHQGLYVKFTAKTIRAPPNQ